MNACRDHLGQLNWESSCKRRRNGGQSFHELLASSERISSNASYGLDGREDNRQHPAPGSLVAFVGSANRGLFGMGPLAVAAGAHGCGLPWKACTRGSSQAANAAIVAGGAGRDHSTHQAPEQHLAEPGLGKHRLVSRPATYLRGRSQTLAGGRDGSFSAAFFIPSPRPCQLGLDESGFRLLRGGL